MPIKHLVLFKFTAGADTAQRDRWVDDLTAWASTVEGTSDVVVGPDISRDGKAAGFTHAASLTYADEAARDRYLDHPRHIELRDRLEPILDQIVVVDIEMGAQ